LKYFRLILLFYLFLINNYTFSQYDNYGVPDFDANEKQTKFRFNFDLGYGNWNKTINNGTQDFIVDYYHGLKDGFDIEAGAIYFPNKFIGIGLTGLRFDAYARLNNVYLIDDTTGNVIAMGFLEDDIAISFIGATFCHRFKPINKKYIIQLALTPGYFYYRNYKSWVIYNDKITGTSFGINFALNLDFQFSDNFGVGFGTNILTGSIKEVEINGELQQLDKNENLTRINFTIGFKVYI